MRGLESLMLAALVALLGLGIWQGRNWLPGILRHTIPAPLSSTAKPATELHPKVRVKKSRLSHGKSTKPEFAAVDRLLAEQNSSTVVVVPLPGMPKAGSIKAGTSRAELRARYGDPTLDVAARRDGRMIERFYYLSEDQSQITVATLQDGAVTHAETVSR
ncbi:MAG TPA: hypothetical protein VLJ11_07570 [Bryobacteraceae bacterium]|nr:hypothetical protein [Bryobacteraceae bacterium]